MLWLEAFSIQVKKVGSRSSQNVRKGSATSRSMKRAAGLDGEVTDDCSPHSTVL